METVSKYVKKIQFGSLWNLLCECLDLVRDLEVCKDLYYLCLLLLLMLFISLLFLIVVTCFYGFSSFHIIIQLLLIYFNISPSIFFSIFQGIIDNTNDDNLLSPSPKHNKRNSSSSSSSANASSSSSSEQSRNNARGGRGGRNAAASGRSRSVSSLARAHSQAIHGHAHRNTNQGLVVCCVFIMLHNVCCIAMFCDEWLSFMHIYLHMYV